ncbi:MAG: hypothetical protein Aurels2KO_42440 [Aureliella sp.]
MHFRIQTASILSVFACAMLSLTPSAGAQPPASHAVSFPWGCNDCAPTPQRPANSPYRTLQKRATASARAIQEMPTKTPYAYGWFGHNPTPKWTRQFGFSTAYTQWSLE